MDELKDGGRLNPELNLKLDDHELEYKKITLRLMKGYHDWESKKREEDARRIAQEAESWLNNEEEEKKKAAEEAAKKVEEERKNPGR